MRKSAEKAFVVPSQGDAGSNLSVPSTPNGNDDLLIPSGATGVVVGVPTGVAAVPPPASATPASQVEAAPTAHYGLNAAQLGVQKYGDTDEIVSDVASLSAAMILRQPGNADVLLSLLLFAGDRDDKVIVLPLKEDLPDSWNDDVVENLKDLLRSAHENRISVRLTLGTLGIGGQTLDEAADGALTNAISLTWDPAHQDKVLDGEKFLAGISSDTDDESLRDHFDTRDPYQRIWMREYTSAVCDLLESIESELQGEGLDFHLYNVIDAIEVFNEIDACNVIKGSEGYPFGKTAWESSAQAWAQTCEPMAKVIADRFGHLLPAALPSIASYDVDEALLTEAQTALGQHAQSSKAYLGTWTWKIRFFKAFMQEFVVLAEDDGFTDSTSILQVARSVDYHWYHKLNQFETSVGPLHISRLTWECQRIRSTLDALGMVDTAITVFENGSPALEEEPATGREAVFPASIKSVGTASAEEVYQAYDVWRRLCGAAAGGATVLGWHSYQSNREVEGGAYFGHGIRDDDSNVKSSISAFPRLSYFMYRLFASTFTAYQECSIAWPHAGFLPVNRTSDEVGRLFDAVVFEFVGVITSEGDWHDYIYVIVLDRWRDTSGGSVTGVTTTGAPAHIQSGVVVSQSDSVADTSVTGEGNLPGGTSDLSMDGFYSFDGDITSVRVVLTPNDGDIIMIKSNSQLRWDL